MSFSHLRGYRSFAPPPTTLPSPVTPSSWADRMRSTMRGTLGGTPPAPQGNTWSFPSFTSVGSRFYDWEQPFHTAADEEPSASSDSITVEPIDEAVHSGLRLRTLPPYPPHSMVELVPSRGKTAFILGRQSSDRDLARTRSDGSSDGSDGEVEIVDLHSRVVSKKHARIEFIGEEVYITDLQSTHGTWVLREGSTDQFLGNDVPFLLKDGDEIRIGRRVYDYPAVHLVVDMIKPPRSSISGSGAPVTPHQATAPLTPPPSRRRSTNSFRAPDFSDMDISRSPSPSPASAPTSALGTGLQSPIVLEDTPSPAPSGHISPAPSPPDLPAYMPSPSSLPDDPQETPHAAPADEEPAVARSERIEEIFITPVTSREPRPYEYVSTLTGLEAIPDVVSERHSSPIESPVFDAPILTVQPSLPTMDSPRVHGPTSVSVTEQYAQPADTASHSDVFQTVDPNHLSASSALLDEADLLDLPQDLRQAVVELEVALNVMEHGCRVQTAGHNLSPMEVSATVSGAVLYPTTEAEEQAGKQPGQDRQEAVEEVPVQAKDLESASSDAPKQPEDRHITNASVHVQKLSSILSEIRGGQASDHGQLDEKWKTVDEIMKVLQKDSEHPVVPGEHGSRKRRRDETDEDNMPTVEPFVSTVSNAEVLARDIRPLKRRRSLVPSPTTFAFVLGGVAMWAALGVDYGL